MVVDSWDGVFGEFCLSVVPCGVSCGDASCAPVETYCDCSGDCACDFANFGLIRYDEVQDGYFFTDDLTENVAVCSQFLGANSDNIYLGAGATNFTPCAGAASEMTITYDNGTLGSGPGGIPIPSGSTIATGTLFFFELTPADVAVGSITINACVDDGLGNQCCQDIVFDFSMIPTIANPYCVLTCFAGDIDPTLLNQTVCVDGTIQLCADGTEDLTLPCNSDDGSSYQFGWQVIGAGGYALSNFVLFPSGCETVLTSDVLIDEFGYVDPFIPGTPLSPGTYTLQGAAFCVNSDGTTVEACGTPSVMTVILDPAGTCPIDVPGCTDPCDPNYDPNATVNDPALCAGYSTDCNADCTAGPFGGTWDPATCACINETAPVNGCTDNTACNFDAAANCDDSSCDFGNVACPDPCNPVMGCTDAAACNFDAMACVDDGSCDLGNTACADPCNPVFGCTDAAACNFDPAACVDDSSCLAAPTCNTDPCVGDIEIIDPNDACACIVDTPQVNGCTDAAACNYDASANCDDGSCDLTAGCTDPNACNYNAAACVDDGTCDLGNTACPDPCNEPDPDDGCDLTTDSFDAATCTVTNTPNCAAGEMFNASTCMCDTQVIPGCIDPCADNFDPTANEDDGSCNPYDDTCNADCTVGPFGGTWDPATCGCVNETTPVNGCTDPAAGNYDAAANCDDGSCVAACGATAATITGGPFSFCAEDGTPDFVSGITVSGGTGANTAWVITDDLLNILGLPGMPGEVDFDVAGFGTCLIWYVTFDDIAGAEVGMNAADLTGCFALSNSIDCLLYTSPSPRDS